MKKYFIIIMMPFFLLYTLHTSANVSATLLQLNNTTLKFYQQAKFKQKLQLDPVIIIFNNHLSYYYKKNKLELNITPDEYTQLKTYAQLSLGVFSLMQLQDQASFWQQLADYKAKIMAAEEMINHLSLTIEQKRRQKEMVNLSLQFLNHCLNKHAIDTMAYQTYFKSIEPHLWRNINDATMSQLTLLHKQIKFLQNKTSQKDWQHLKVVVVGPHMPRAKNIFIQYFSRLLNCENNSDQLLYAEGVNDEKSALDLLARMNLDTRLSSTALDDPTRMRRDLLADSGEKFIAKLFS